MSLTYSLLLFITCLLGFFGVAAGAFGAHALKETLSPSALNTFEVAVRYQMYHVFAIFAAVWLGSPTSAWLFLSGILLFSGSLYLISLGAPSFLGIITPIGGTLFLLGWIALSIKVLK